MAKVKINIEESAVHKTFGVSDAFTKEARKEVGRMFEKTGNTISSIVARGVLKGIPGIDLGNITQEAISEINNSLNPQSNAEIMFTGYLLGQFVQGLEGAKEKIGSILSGKSSKEEKDDCDCPACTLRRMLEGKMEMKEENPLEELFNKIKEDNPNIKVARGSTSELMDILFKVMSS